MEKFNLTKNYSVECKFLPTQKGFKHIATLWHNDKKEFTTSVNYLNRTWESYEFKSVLLQAVDLQFKNEIEHKYFRDIVVNYK